MSRPFLNPMYSLGTSNRTQGAILVGSGGSRGGAGSLGRIYNWCHTNNPNNALNCTFGIKPKPKPEPPKPKPKLFVMVFQIPEGGATIVLPLVHADPDISIDWGDGSTTSGNADFTHPYASGGTFQVTISDHFTQFGFGYIANPDGGDNIHYWQGVQYVTQVLSFNDHLTSLTTAFMVNTETESQTSLLTNVPASIPAITDLSYTFGNCSIFNDPAISKWNTNQVTNMYAMFLGASAFNQSVSNFDTSQVTDMSAMFNCSNLNLIIMDFNNGYTQDEGGYTLFTNPPTEKLTNTLAMFVGCSFFNGKVDNWNMSNVTEMRSMFRYASAFNQTIGNSWKLSAQLSPSSSLINFINGTAVDQANYNTMLQIWATQYTNDPSTFPTGIEFTGSTSSRITCNNDLTNYNTLTGNPPGWTIN